MTLYRDIIVQAFKSTWKSKYLWFFGLFAAILTGGGDLELIYRGFNQGSPQAVLPGLSRLAETSLFSLKSIGNIFRLAQDDFFAMFIALGVFLLVVAISLFLLWLALVSQGALVHNSGRIRMNKKHSFKDGLETGLNNFWPVLALNLVFKLVIYLVFLILSWPIIATFNQVGAAATSMMYIFAFIIFIPVSIVLSFIIKYAIAFTVIKKEKLLNSLKQSWRLFSRNWLVSLEMAFLLFFINFAAGLLLVLIFLIFSVPFIFTALVFAKFSLFFNFWIIVLVAILFYIVFIALAGAFLTVFQISSWTSLFIELVSRGGVSKLVRIFGKE
jgi:hypothetical protein